MRTSAEQPSNRRIWRLLESNLLTHLVRESVFDFYAGILSPQLTARRIVARVESVREECASVKSFVLHPNGHFGGFKAGQHVDLTVEIDGVRHSRFYSPSNAPDTARTVVLTVKRHPGGRVSGWLHDRLKVGDFVELGQAFGDFMLPPGDPGKLLFIAGGSGITPIASLLRDLCARAQALDVAVLVYARTYSDVIFANDLRALSGDHPGVRVGFSLTRQSPANGDLAGRFSPAHLARIAPDALEREAFVCGPRALIASVESLWRARGVSSPLNTETFAPPENAAASTVSVRVNAARTGRSFVAHAASSLLVQAERAGLSPESGCRRGICSRCTCRKRRGIAQDLSTGAISSEPDEDIRLCVSVPLSELTLDL